MSVLPSRLAALLVSLAGLSACGPTIPDGPDLAAPKEEAAPVVLDPALLLPPGERALRIEVHVRAALALASAGEGEEAAAQLRAATNQIDPGELPGLEALGFDPAAFDEAALMLQAGAAPQDAQALLDTVAENTAALRAQAGKGAPAEEIAWLMKQCLKEYRRGVSLDNRIEDVGAYQDAYGYAVVAQEVADGLDDEAGDLRLELKLLVLMWPDAGPVWDEVPAPVLHFANQVSRVELASAALE
ncbi:MAG: hypothetical protein R3C13_06905 [Hyphomonas sp.]|uniref:hypothetical protein n=1 Tax=Hyphomonas sp. TaxID=87 RepID=UPI003527ADEB